MMDDSSINTYRVAAEPLSAPVVEVVEAMVEVYDQRLCRVL